MVEKGKGAWQNNIVIIKFDFVCWEGGGEEKNEDKRG